MKYYLLLITAEKGETKILVKKTGQGEEYQLPYPATVDMLIQSKFMKCFGTGGYEIEARFFTGHSFHGLIAISLSESSKITPKVSRPVLEDILESFRAQQASVPAPSAPQSDTSAKPQHEYVMPRATIFGSKTASSPQNGCLPIQLTLAWQAYSKQQGATAYLMQQQDKIELAFPNPEQAQDCATFLKGKLPVKKEISTNQDGEPVINLTLEEARTMHNLCVSSQAATSCAIL